MYRGNGRAGTFGAGSVTRSSRPIGRREQIFITDRTNERKGKTMDLAIKPKEIYSLLPTDILFQTVYWSQVKSRLGWKPFAFDLASSGSTGDVLVLTRALAGGISAAYIPQGPEHGPVPEQYGPFLEELSERIAGYLDPEVAFIRYDLPWKSQYCGEEGLTEERWADQPEPRLRELRMNFGTKRWNLRKAPLDLTVADTMVLDITGGTEEILSRMKPKTRYNIRLAEKKGVRAFTATIGMLPIFYNLYQQTAQRNGFTACEYEYFSALFSVLICRPDPSEVHFLLATHKEEVLAGAIIAISGRTAAYLFGASSNHNRSLMGPYAVQWEAIKLARARRCVVYDMGAVSPTRDPDHSFYGMYRFKSGFGGRVVHRNGSWDYPLDGDKYQTLRNAEALSRVMDV